MNGINLQIDKQLLQHVRDCVGSDRKFGFFTIDEVW